MDLTKQQSTILKGTAILMMLFLHLFNHLPYVRNCQPILYLQGDPLVYLLTKFTAICVPMYLFLSGYGLYIISADSKRTLTFKTGIKRIFLLYINFWIILLIFIPIGIWLVPGIYPGTWINIISNITAWNTSYNGEWWFLFPYIVLVFTAGRSIKLVKKYNLGKLLVGLLGLYILTYFMIYFNRVFLYEHQFAYMPLLCLNLAPVFLFGALFAKEAVFEKVRLKTDLLKSKNAILISAIFLLIAIRMLLPVAIFNIFFAIAFMLLFSQLNLSIYISRFLIFMGEHSTNMWLTHTFFCYYFFKEFIYSFRYPVIIYVVLITVSVLASFGINIIYKPILKSVKSSQWFQRF